MGLQYKVNWIGILEEIQNLNILIKELEKRINIIEEEKHMDNLKKIEERVNNVEEFLIKRSRGFYLR